MAGHGCCPTGNGYLYRIRGSMTSFDFYSIRYALPVFYLSKNRTENRFPVPVRAVNRVPVHETTRHRDGLT